jgi:hypothetical protein
MSGLEMDHPSGLCSSAEISALKQSATLHLCRLAQHEGELGPVDKSKDVTLRDSGTPGRRVDFVGVNFGERFVDGLVEAGEQLGQSFARMAEQHGQAIIFVGGHGDATNWI